MEKKTDKITKGINLFLKAKEVLVVLATGFLWILGIWLSYRLLPIKNDIHSIVTRVEALETHADDYKENSHELDIKVDHIAEDVAYIRGKLE